MKGLTRIAAINTLLISTLISASYTTFIPRQITFDSTYELALTNYAIYHNRTRALNRWCVDIYAVPFFQQSRNRNAITRYLLPNNSECLNIQENGTGNIGSLSLELISAAGSTFSSLVTISPERKAYGSQFNIQFDLSPLLSGLWGNIVFTTMGARHNLHLCEGRVANPGTLPRLQTATQALNNLTWLYGKLSRCSLSKSGVDDIQFKLGWDWYFWDDQSHIGLYGVVSAPTGKGTSARFLFEPLMGSNHATVGAGVNGDFSIYQWDSASINFMLDFKYRFAVQSQEIRSFDLCPNGDWSRYVQVVEQKDPTFSMPGINFFTKPMHVTPRSTIDLWSALHYQHCCFDFEIGYNLWWRQSEKLSLVCCLPSDIGILDMSGLCTPPITSSSTFLICQTFDGPNAGTSDAIFTPETNSNINLSSAAAPGALTNKIYGAAAYNIILYDVSLLAGIGASYEVAQGDTALENWALWGKLGLSF